MTKRMLILLAGLAPAFAPAAAQHVGSPWPRHEIDNTFLGADGVRLADANGDGLLDIATGWEQSGVVRVYINPGQCDARSKWPAVTVGNAGSPEDAILFDVDGDGAVDVVTCAEEPTRKVWVHWAPTDPGLYLDPAAWTMDFFPAAPASAWMYCVPVQIDGQNGVDLVVASRQPNIQPFITQVGWLRAPANPRDLSAWTFHRMNFVFWTMTLMAEDMDGDGDLDIALTDQHSFFAGARWLKNPGVESGQQTGVWQSFYIGAPGERVSHFDMADLDGDGLRDAVVPVIPNKIYWFERLDLFGTKWEQRQIQYPLQVGTPKAAQVGDIDQDGFLDVVMSFADSPAPKSGVVWLRNSGDPTDFLWPAHEVSGEEGVKFDLVPLVDLDGDGDLDIITTEENNNGAGVALGLIWYENPLYAGTPGDANADGRVDFADLNVVLGAFGQSGPSLPGDLDGDGDVDFADLNVVLGAYGLKRCP